ALYDIQGREVLHVNSRGAFRSINIAHLAQGMYLWKLVYEDGKQENGKMVKQ
ncbi:MAG: T9SS type A sorting domain-containing protein, partial [Bacteroidetes bacterium]|nr:T9SS type A sorting domain-containing protein [Bacteroidota bacterium]